jgi:hypothetical protein
MKISFHSILFIFLFLTIWTAAMPTPRPFEFTFEPEVRGYYDELGSRNVEKAGELVSRKIHISAGARRFFSKVGNVFKKIGKGIVTAVKKVGSVVSSLPIP